MQTTTSLPQRALDTVWRRRWLCILPLLLIPSLAILAVILLPKKYYAVATTRATKDEVTETLSGPRQDWWVTISGENVAAFMDLKGDDKPGGFLARALARAQLSQPINLDPRSQDPRGIALRKNLTAYTTSAEVFVIRLDWDDPRECERIVAAMQEEYRSEAGRAKQQKLLATQGFLVEQIEAYEKRMREAEQALIEFKEANYGQLPEAAAAELRQLTALRTQANELRIRMKESELRRQSLQTRLAQISPTSIKEQILVDDPVAVRLRELEAEREALLIDYKPNSDEVQAIDARIASARQVLAAKAQASTPEGKRVQETRLETNPTYVALTTELGQVQIEREAQRSRLDSLLKTILEYQARIQRLPSAQRALTDRTRDYNILKGQFENLLAQREQVRLKGEIANVAAQSSLRPLGMVYAEPSTGKKKALMIVFAGCLLALLTSVGLVFLAEWTDPTLRYEEDAEHLIGLPVLGSISELPAGSPWLPALGEGSSGPVPALPSPLAG